MTATLMLFDPTAARVAGALGVAHSMLDLAGKVVGFIDNTKPNFRQLAADVGELLVEKYGVARVVMHQKRNASTAAAAEVIASLAGECDVVVTGSGD